MRRFVCFFILFIVLIVSAFADTYGQERVFYYTDGGTQWNITNVDLSKAFYVPKYGTIYSNDTNDNGSPENGTYAKKVNVIGNAGCCLTDHVLKYTISTSGRFVSQSDPTKYRDFYVAVVPRHRKDTTDYYYKYKSDLSGDVYGDNERVPNSRNGDIVLYSPPMPKNPNNTYSTLTFTNGSSINLDHYYFDICLCMDELTTEDYLHLSEDNDYIATITVTWECMEYIDSDDTCPKSFHYGSCIFTINGYYGDGMSGSSKEVFLQVTPEVSSMNLDLVDIAKNSPNSDIKISDLQIYTMTSKKAWLNRISVFISSSQSFNSQSATGFRLMNDKGYYIPYVVDVKNYDLTINDHTELATANAVFNGTTAYSKNMTNKITLKQYDLVGKKKDNIAYTIAYGANVYIRFIGYIDDNNTPDTRTQGSGIPSSGDIIAYSIAGQPNQTVKDAGSDDSITASTVSAALAGIYTSNIYYYIIYD